MQVLLHADPNIQSSQQMAAHLESIVQDALGRFGEQVTRVEAHLAAATSHATAAADEVHCTLEARLVGREPVVVKDQAGSAHQAIQGAVGKLKRAVATALAKHHDPRRASAVADQVAASAADTD